MTVMPDLAQKEVETAPGSNGVLLQANGLTISTRAGVRLLSDISFHIEPGELVAVAGLSRLGKSTLLQCLAGLVKPESGEVLIDGLSLYANLKAFRPWIGYVPAEFALHPHLTVLEVLQDAARLRLPRRTSSSDRRQRLQSVLETTGLLEVRDQQVSHLSGVEKRRLSVAVEIIAYPKLLLVDESAEPITPFDEVQIIILMRELSRQGITVLLVNPRCRSIGLSDRILFLAPGGYMAWFGPAEETLEYLKRFLPRGVVKDMFGLQEALEMLVNAQTEDGSAWAKRFRDHEAYQKYVDDPLNNRYPDLLLQTRPLLRIRLRSSAKEKLPPPIVPRAGLIQKFLLLVRRTFRLLWRDGTWFSMLVIPPLVALAFFLFSSTLSTEASRSPLAAGLPVFIVILTSALLVQYEILKERPVYQRENQTSSILVSYVLSKVFLVGIWAIYQGLVWTIVDSLRELGPVLAVGLQTLLPAAITFSLLSFVGGVLGLIVSSLARTAMTPGWVLLLTLPLLFFMFDPLSHWSRWAIISLLLIVLLTAIQQRATRQRT
jgi:ABC-type multidrug transport system ATPase subunit